MFTRHRKPTRDDQSAAPSPVVALNDRGFRTQLTGRHTVVDFWAPWCGPCLSFAPVFEAAARDHDGPLTFAKCTVDDNQAIARQLGIRGIPTLVVFGPDGAELGRVVGGLSARQFSQTLARVSRLAAADGRRG